MAEDVKRKKERKKERKKIITLAGRSIAFRWGGSCSATDITTMETLHMGVHFYQSVSSGDLQTFRYLRPMCNFPSVWFVQIPRFQASQFQVRLVQVRRPFPIHPLPCHPLGVYRPFSHGLLDAVALIQFQGIVCGRCMMCSEYSAPCDIVTRLYSHNAIVGVSLGRHS